MITYRVFNKSRKVLLASEVEVADTLWGRLKGLLGRSAGNFASGQGLWLVPSQGIHTIGMNFSIDVVYLDAGGRVIRMYHKLAPFRAAAVMRRAYSVLELPPGTLEKSLTGVGDLLDIRINGSTSNKRGERCAIDS